MSQIELFSVAILAGGHGVRLGQEKALVLAAGRPLLHWTAGAAACDSLDLAIPNLDGKAQPRLAAYRRSCLPLVETQLDAGEGPRIRAIVPRLRQRVVERAELALPDPRLESFHNISYREDVDRIAARLAPRGSAQLK